MPNALQLTKSFEHDELTQPSEKSSEYIYGIRETEMENVLLMTDYQNGAVKSLDVWTSEVHTLWRIEEAEQELGWHVLNACVCNRNGWQLLVIAEHKLNKWRICTASRRNSSDGCWAKTDNPFQAARRKSLGQSQQVCKMYMYMIDLLSVFISRFRI